MRGKGVKLYELDKLFCIHELEMCCGALGPDLDRGQS
jgi:hypothetical protein